MKVWTVLHDPCLTILQGAVFGPLTNIKTITFIDVGLSVTELSRSFAGLERGTVDEITIQTTEISELGLSFFKPLAATNVTKLDLSYNYIRQIVPGFSLLVPKLEYFVLSRNSLINLKNVLEMLSLHSLKALDISYEDVFFFSTERPSLSSNAVDPSSNSSLTSYRHQYSDPYCDNACLSNGSLHISTNSIEAIHARRFLSPTILCTVYYPFCFEQPNRILEVDCSLNQFDTMTSYICGLDQLESLNMAENGCKHLPPGFFQTFPRLRNLSIASNHLAGILDRRSFSINNNITILDLSENGFNDSSISFITNLRAIHSLTLRKNHLSILEISGLPHLNYLDLSMNNISLSTTFLERLDYLSNVNEITVDLSENPLTTVQRCCDIIPFIKWIGQTRVRLKNFGKYVCILQNQRQFMQTVSLPLLSSECKPNKGLGTVTSIVLFFSIFCVTSVVLSLLYRGRWTVRWWMYMFRRLFKMKEQIRNPRGYKYDAFVAYSGDDVIWVRQELIPRLEEENHFTLCIHQRDFTPGIPIEENIVMAVLESRKTILLINDNFLSSNYCHFEVHMARQKLFDENDDIIIPVILESFNWGKLSHTLRNILSQNTYIEWTNDVTGQKLFWKKMVDSLKLKQGGSYFLD